MTLYCDGFTVCAKAEADSAYIEKPAEKRKAILSAAWEQTCHAENVVLAFTLRP